MKLFYISGTCALAPHIVIRDAGLDVELVEVRRENGGHVYGNGIDYRRVNPLGKVPALEVDGNIITETQVILRFLATLKPDLLPFPSSGMAHWRMLEVLNFITTEIHRTFSPLWSAHIADAHRREIIQNIGRAFSRFESILGKNEYLGGNSFSVADAYAFVATGWAELFDLDFEPWPLLSAYRERIFARPGTQTALREQGLL
ncbi:glutathione binding-like protein [Thalassospira marina]|nr:glutathione binding-like protein [Thalassospira marina]